METSMMSTLRRSADVVLDTSKITLHQLKKRVNMLFSHPHSHRFHVDIISFGYKYGVPEAANLVFDIRYLKNPYFVPALRDKSGRDKEVQNFITQQDDFLVSLNHFMHLFDYLFERYQNDGKKYLTLAFGCTGGRHRSVTMAHVAHETLQTKDISTQVFHRDVSKS